MLAWPRQIGCYHAAETSPADSRDTENMFPAFLPIPRQICRSVSLAVLLISSQPLSAARPQEPSTGATTTRTFTDPRLGLTVVGTEVDLPIGRWEVAAVTPPTAVDQVVLVSRLSHAELPGRRGLTAAMKEIAETAELRLQFVYEAISEYAAAHSGIGPRSLSEIDPRTMPFLAEAIDSPWPQDADRRPRVLTLERFDLLGPGLHIAVQDAIR
jgi:hypothetical protein